ncbi:MAG TPA: sulfatase [Bacteroidales bacterium]
MHTRLIFIICFILTGVFLKAQQPTTMSAEHPNVVLIVSHGHGTDDLGCYGNSVIKTPNLDKLASEGVKFTNAYTTVSSANASLSVILTGLYNHAIGQYGQSEGQSHFSVFPEIKSLPKYLKDADYRCARIGIFPLDNLAFKFDTSLGAGINSRNTYQMAESCLSFLKQTDKPFFLYLGMADPFRSNEANDEDISLINSFGNNKQGYDGIIPTFYKPGKMIVPFYLPDSPECRKELAQYAQAVSRMDLGIGRLLELLKETGNWNNTLIIYISDNGIAFPGAQNTMYQPGIKLPCIIKPPFETYSNSTCDAMINWADITPTILDICHSQPADYPFHGRSFKEAMSLEHPQGWDELFASFTFHEITMYYPMRMVMNRRYKLIHNIAWQLPFPLSNDLAVSVTWQETLKSFSENYGRRSVHKLLQHDEYELYDLITDPEETKNLASNPDYADVLKDLQSRLKGFQVRTNDPWVIF